MRLRGPPAREPRHATLVGALAEAAGHWSGVTFLDLHEREVRLSWGEIRDRARRAAAALAERGVRPGDPVAIVLRTEPAFLDAFFGTWLAGAVPVPLYPPVRLGRIEEYLAATARMLSVSRAALVVSGGGTLRLLGEAVERGGTPLGLLDAAGLVAGGRSLARAPSAGDLGLVQFSSGSTVDPKPVALTHGALAAQVGAVLGIVAPTQRDALVSWLPLYHDMGLIGCLLGALSHPAPAVLIPPEHFLARPALWLRAIARHRGTVSAAPSFAYAYCADRVKDEELEGCDLSSWRLALDGAEPVSGDAMRRFAERFAPFGFSPGALVPVYGLSEAALAVTFSAPGGPLAGLRIDATRLARDGLVAPGEREVVAVGAPIPGVEVELRGPDGRPASEGRLGRIWVRGPSLMRGYLGDDAATARALVDGWLDTGDLGFVRRGLLYVHGRARDLVIVRGANHAPDEFEAALAGLPGVRSGCAVAAGFTPRGGGGEELLILAERARGEEEEYDGVLATRIRAAVTGRTGVSPHTVRILAPGTLPRTSSGKLRRGEAVRRFLAGTLAPPPAASLLRLAVGAARARLALARVRRRSSG
ncbi:MAG TPA: AMP-binding protein [Anaeromyxobacteraceae bacterium]|nr:AMP-binding protein [Anaeromyxobacteraceae bacterium]